MGVLFCMFIVTFSLLIWWFGHESKPKQPPPEPKPEPEQDVYKPTGEQPKCHNCGAVLGIWYNVMLCDPCLGQQINNTEAAKRRHVLGETVEVNGAMSIDELERLWQNSR